MGHPRKSWWDGFNGDKVLACLRGCIYLEQKENQMATG